jgi:hypothetical protein
VRRTSTGQLTVTGIEEREKTLWPAVFWLSNTSPSTTNGTEPGTPTQLPQSKKLGLSIDVRLNTGCSENAVPPGWYAEMVKPLVIENGALVNPSDALEPTV